MERSISPTKAWFLAARPRTLPVSLPPILVGTALASQIATIHWELVIFALLCSLGIQIGTNLVNDAIDFKKGADGKDRVGPQRMTQGGFLSFRQVLFGGVACFAFALFCGIPLIMVGGAPILWILLLAAACGYLYTGGPLPLAYTGLSDFFVLLFFGWVATGILYYIQTGTLSAACWVAGTQIGCLAIVPHAINNLRDIKEDAKVNKRTLAVRFGPRFARCEIAFCSFIPFLMGLYWLLEGNVWMFALPFFALPLFFANVRNIWIHEPSSLYNEYLPRSALCGLIFSCLLAIGIFLG